MNRRGFLAGILAAGVAPAAVGSSILMPVRAIAPASGLTLAKLRVFEARLRSHEDEWAYWACTPPIVEHWDGRIGRAEIGRYESFRFIETPLYQNGVLVGTLHQLPSHANFARITGRR